MMRITSLFNRGSAPAARSSTSLKSTGATRVEDLVPMRGCVYGVRTCIPSTCASAPCARRCGANDVTNKMILALSSVQFAIASFD